MKTTLFGMLLLASTVCSAQPARTLENTSNSWFQPNLSIENFNGRGIVVAGTTDQNPATGYQTPLFKFTDPNLGIPPGPFPSTYYTDFGVAEDRYLMDFTVDENRLWIIMVTMGPNNLVAGASNLYVTIVDLISGNPIDHVNVTPFSPVPSTYIPQQIIHSTAQNQYVVVGSILTGPLTAANYASVPKTGFMLILDAGLPMNTISLIETDTPGGPAGNDFDMLESVTEVPGYGYFAGGSVNGVVNPDEQNAMVMNATYGGAAGPSCVADNTTFRSVASSVMYNAATNQVIVMGNNSDFRTYELARFNGVTVLPGSSAVRHNIAGLSPTSIVNGFRLQQDAGGGRIIVGGYVWDPANPVAQLSPFQTTTTPAFTAFVNAKLFQSDNNAPLNGYFDESGAPVFINTPDIVSYRALSNQTFLVNPNSNMGGFDMLRSTPAANLGCEIPLQFSAVSSLPSLYVNVVAYTTAFPGVPSQSAAFMGRGLMDNVLCASTPLAPIGHDEPGLVAGTQVKLFPNPAKDQLEIETETTIEAVIVYDLKGNQVLSVSATDKSFGIRQLDISNLKPGVYILSVKDASGIAVREQFIKE